MFNIQVFVSLALLVVVFGKWTKIDFELDCDDLKYSTLSPQEVEGQWYGAEMYKNIGVGKLYDEKKKPACMGATVDVFNSTRYQVKMYSFNGIPEFDSDVTFNADLQPSGHVFVAEDVRKYGVLVAQIDKRYVTIAFCMKMDDVPYAPVMKVVTYRRAGQPDLMPEEQKMLHEMIETNIGFKNLQVAKLYCRDYDKN